MCVGTVDGKLTLWNTLNEKLIAMHEEPELHVDYLTWNELTGELVVGIRTIPNKASKLSH